MTADADVEVDDERELLGVGFSHQDPVTGQAGWYDVRVRLRACSAGEAEETSPQAQAMPQAPGALGTIAGPAGLRAGAWKALSYFAGRPAGTPTVQPSSKTESGS